MFKGLKIRTMEFQGRAASSLSIAMTKRFFFFLPRLEEVSEKF